MSTPTLDSIASSLLAGLPTAQAVVVAVRVVAAWGQWGLVFTHADGSESQQVYPEDAVQTLDDAAVTWHHLDALADCLRAHLQAAALRPSTPRLEPAGLQRS